MQDGDPSRRPCTFKQPPNHANPQNYLYSMQEQGRLIHEGSRKTKQDHAHETSPTDPFRMQHCRPGDFCHESTI